MAKKKMATRSKATSARPSAASLLKLAKTMDVQPDMRGRPRNLKEYEPALKVLRSKNMSYKAIFNLLKAQGVDTNYSTVRLATKRAAA